MIFSALTGLKMLQTHCLPGSMGGVLGGHLSLPNPVDEVSSQVLADQAVAAHRRDLEDSVVGQQLRSAYGL